MLLIVRPFEKKTISECRKAVVRYLLGNVNNNGNIVDDNKFAFVY
jgi:hypothetical protein